jgi:hypothetical protein
MSPAACQGGRDAPEVARSSTQAVHLLKKEAIHYDFENADRCLTLANWYLILKFDRRF